ncbi:MAG: glycosyltransferase, partial [Flavobacteriales bacterium]|nr:glycosyltransferase [Flavobacteriales bacterium]
MKKLIRITTVPISLRILLKGQLAFMRNHFEVLAISAGPQEELEEVGIRESVPTKMVEMTRFITPLQDLKAVWQLYRLFRKEKPHIVHTHTPKAGIVGMLAAKLAGVPHRLHTVAGLPLLEATGGKRKLLDAVEKITYRCATKIYPNSKGLYDIIIQQGYIKSHPVIASEAKQPHPVIASEAKQPHPVIASE